jgi:hypothetical protein
VDAGSNRLAERLMECAVFALLHVRARDTRPGGERHIGAPSGVLRAEERTPPVTRFPDSRISAPFTVFPDTRSSDCPSTTSSGVVKVLPAYSGGTVWAFHPLRVTAGVGVELSVWIPLERIHSAQYSKSGRGGSSPGCLWRSFLRNITRPLSAWALASATTAKRSA